MAETFLEVERRYKVPDVDACLKHIAELGITTVSSTHLVDEWYIPDTIKSQAEHDTWYNQDFGVAWRIRHIYEDDGEKLEVTSKQLTTDNNHNSFHETSAEFADYEAAVKFMTDQHYRNWLTIDKTRYLLASSNPDIDDSKFELILDYVAGLAEKIGVGACLEIEHKSTLSRDEALEQIAQIAHILGFEPEDLFEKSLTVTAMSELARL